VTSRQSWGAIGATALGAVVGSVIAWKLVCRQFDRAFDEVFK
jgi:hypothetical protein